MVLHLDYNTIFQVIGVWEKLRRMPDFEKVAGTILFQSLFSRCPSTKVVFGFPLDMDPNSKKLLTSRRFLMHASLMIQMLDKALNMLGPDVELLAEILADLGKKHAKFGVKEEYFQYMGEALHEMLQLTLKSHYTDQDADAWAAVYGAFSTEMRKSMEKQRVVFESWEKLKKIDDYKNVAGMILFQSLFEKCPPSKTLFGFPIDLDPESKLMVTSRRFKMHSSYFIEMIDNALNMMEKDKLQENLKQLGKIHSSYGVKKEYFPLMGEALIYTLKQVLKQDFNSEVEKVWIEVYDNLSTQIINTMNSFLHE